MLPGFLRNGKNLNHLKTPDCQIIDKPCDCQSRQLLSRCGWGAKIQEAMATYTICFSKTSLS